MAKFKIVISDPETSRASSLELEGSQAAPLIGRKLGEVVDGSIVKMVGYKLKVTGGSDKDGFPMRPSVHGGVRVGAILSEGVGFHPTKKGERKRKKLRGNVITEEVVQINMKVFETPSKTEKPKRKRKPKKQSVSSLKRNEPVS